MNLSSEVQNKHIKTYKGGQIVFREGEEGDFMYVILEGSVEIIKHTGQGTGKILTTLQKGDFFGEMSLVDAKRRSADAVCKEETKLLLIDNSVLNKVLDGNPDFAEKMIRTLARRLRNTNKLLEEALSGNLNRVVFEGLREYAAERGMPNFKGLRVNIDDFSEWAGQRLAVTPKQAFEAVRTLVERGMVQTSAMGENEVVIPRSS